MTRPAYQWYPGDFRRKTALQACSWEARALWRDLLDIMHDGQPYGHLAANGNAIPLERVATMIGLSLPRVRRYLAELEASGVSSRTDDGILFSRRMVRDEVIRQARAAGGIKSQDHPKVPKKKKVKGYPSDRPSRRPSGDPPSSPSASPSGGPLQFASASAVDLPTPNSGVGSAPPNNWPARLAAIFTERIGHATPAEMGTYFGEAVKLHGEDLVALALTEYAKTAPHTEKPQFLNPKSAARQIGIYIGKLKPIKVYDDKTGEPTPEFLHAVGRDQ